MQQMKQQNSKTLKEHLSENDLKWLVSDNVLIDMHKTKLGDDKDYIVLSIPINDKTPAEDLSHFISNSIYKYEDVEVSPATDTKGRYLIYVELKRTPDAFDIINGILTDSGRLCGIENWKFKSMGLNDYVPLDQESFSAHVITDPLEYDRLHPVQQGEEESAPAEEPTEPVQPAEESFQESIKNRLKFLLNY